MDVHGWIFTLYLRILCAAIVMQKHIVFLPSLGQLAMPNFLQCYQCLQCYQQNNKV